MEALYHQARATTVHTFPNGQGRVSRKARPASHNLPDVHSSVRGLRQCLPQIQSGGVVVRMRLQIDLHAPPEHLLPEKRGDHPYDRGPFSVADRVEDRADIIGILHLHFHRVSTVHSVKVKCQRHHPLDEILPYPPFREYSIYGNELHVAGEAFVEPQFGPPGHGDKISEPLMGQFMADRAGDTAAGGVRSRLSIHEDFRFTIRDRTPILHGPHIEIWYGNEVALGERIFHPVQLRI
mmetsp:Transcript_42970/g.84419  ORF Transcript_42970/g.84419 Transcript_42970/m.84419 type:complete len:237 (-) Transcript_42970:1785-2495(-)